MGSSPLARGLRPGCLAPARRARIIPARAGFTSPASRPTLTLPDHPRSRGVYQGLRGSVTSTPGSSPLARGLPPPTRNDRRPPGIIPARAGFTGATWGSRPRTRDHPRSRGVYVAGNNIFDGVVGSSPLARGLRIGSVYLVPKGRIIPARAGFTSGRVVRAPTPRDHPRSRGVYTFSTHISS